MKLLLLATATYAAKQAAQPRAPGAATPVIPLTNLTQALGGYRPAQDYAVFFYSPYGEAGAYCQRVLPLWDAVSKWHAAKKTKRLSVVKFSCEMSTEHRRLCQAAGVRQFPTISFIAHGSLKWRPFGGKFSKDKSPSRVAVYRGIALADALRDWTMALHRVSELQRLWSGFRQILGRERSPQSVEVEALREELRRRDAEDQNRRLEASIQKMRAKLADAGAERNAEASPTAAKAAAA